MSELSIRVRKLQDNGSSFRATPDTLYLGGIRSAKVDTLRFELPEEWAGCAVTLHVQRLSGTLPDPQILDENNCVVVDRRWTLEKQGMWMLLAAGENGYVAMTKPGQYTCYETIDTDSTTETIDPSVYEQFVELVLKSRNEAVASAEQAKASETAAANSAAAAKESETHAAASEKAAAESARKAAVSENNAADSETKAGESAERAATSETNAKTSEEAGAASAAAADRSQKAAAKNQQDAEAARDAAAGSARAAAASETNARQSAEKAATSEDNAKESETKSKASEEAAKLSETNSATSEKNAADSAAAAQKSAEEAGAKAGTDKTLSIPDAPADAAAVRKLVEDCLAAQRAEDYAKIKFWASPDPTSPAELFGGTWERIEGRMVMGASDSYPVGTTGGSATHTQTVAEMPGHNHTGSTGEAGWHGHSASTNSTGGHTHGAWTGGAGGHNHSVSAATSTGLYALTASADWSSRGAGATVDASSPTTSWVGDHTHGVGMNAAGDHSHTVSVSGNGTHTHTVSIGSTGSGQAMNILNPYYALYLWRRVEEAA